MITYEEALKSAKALKRRIDYCVEYSDGYLFGWKDHDNFVGGNGPIVVLKTDGEKVNEVEYYLEHDAKEVRRFKT